ncbi:hypothetical protein [Caulobacter sp. X]|uniref:hypothetical protein n=1 Tax=Caulobacter sp. X TaxID=2048901 RepID=UPI000C1465FB|nr:hypothetical protein [Caulobacter sp. X]PIB95302.1 hypothetical protein CSW60_22420 [Caulobacter sp. X]
MISQDDQDRIDEYRRIAQSMVASHDTIHEQRAIRDAKRTLLGLVILVSLFGALLGATYLIKPDGAEPPIAPPRATTPR